MTRKNPKFVWVLTADDFCRGTYDGPNGIHCLAGWGRVAFGKTLLLNRAFEELELLCGFIPRFNDKESFEKLAKVWNQAMANLGYTEGNPVKPKKEAAFES